MAGIYSVCVSAPSMSLPLFPIYHSCLSLGIAICISVCFGGTSPSFSCPLYGVHFSFWGILKWERYFGKRFTSKQELIQMIEYCIRYCNTRRVQRNLGILTPMEKHEFYLAAWHKPEIRVACCADYPNFRFSQHSIPAVLWKSFTFFAVLLTGCGSLGAYPEINDRFLVFAIIITDQ